MIVQVGVFNNRAVDQGQSQIACVNGKADALGAVHARLAAAQLGLVGDVVVDKRRRVEVLDGSSRASGKLHVAANGQASRKANERAVTLARVLAVFLQGIVQITVHVGMRARRQVRVDQVTDLVREHRQILFKRFRWVFYVCDDLVNILHSAFLI